MKKLISAVTACCVTCLFGCTFHPPSMSDLADQVRLVNEEKVELRECERNSGIGSVIQCQQRARSWRVPSQGASSVRKADPLDSKGQLQE